jgi:sugar (pentulose or hexulose) kinase
MKKLLALMTIAFAATACGPRQVEVRTGAQPASEVTLKVTNNLGQAANVYVVNGGSDVFLKQVAANATESINVPGISAGSTVGLKATPIDGSRSYTKDNVTLSGVYVWQIP